MPRYEGTDHNHEQYKTPIDQIIDVRPLPDSKDENQSPGEDDGES